MKHHKVAPAEPEPIVPDPEPVKPTLTDAPEEGAPPFFLPESQFEEIYKHATEEPYNALVIDNHPKVDRDKRFKKNFNVVLTHGGESAH